MAHIAYVPDDEASPTLRRGYERSADADGLDNILRIHGLDPPSLGHHVRLYRHLMRGPLPLTRIQREMIAVAVSAANRCFY